MLRRITHIILAIFLLVTTAGVTLSMHYCGGKLVSASINKKAKTCCDGSSGCCENKTIYFKVDNDFINMVQINNIETFELDFLFPFLIFHNYEESIEKEITSKIFCDSSPPIIIQTKLAFLQTYIC